MISGQRRAIILQVDADIRELLSAIRITLRLQLSEVVSHEMIEAHPARVVHQTRDMLVMIHTCLLGATIRHSKPHTRVQLTTLAIVGTVQWVLRLPKQRTQTGLAILVPSRSRIPERL